MTVYYIDDAVTVYHGDCRDILPELEAVDHVITDPPYSEHLHKASRRRNFDAKYHKKGYKTPRSVDLGFEHLSDELRDFCAHQFARLSRRWVLVFSDLETASDWRRSLENAGLNHKRIGVWHKVGSTPQFSGDKPAAAVEAITMAHPAGRSRWNGGGRHGIWSVPIVLERGKASEARVHTTQKPLSLMAGLVADFTDPGEVILDPFGGSGTTALAAAEAGRRCVVIERQEKYAEVTAKRLQNRTLTLPLTEGLTA